jgi:hypothetical protein
MLIYQTQVISRSVDSPSDQADIEELRGRLSSWREDMRFIDDAILTEKARRLDVDAPEPTSPTGDENWQMGEHSSRLYLRPSALARLRREIRAARKDRREVVTFYASLLFGLLGLLIALIQTLKR